MDNKYIERIPKNNKLYKAEYQKAHYKRFSTDISPDTAERIADYCKACEISKADFLRLAIDTLDK